MTAAEKIDAILKEKHLSRRQLAKLAGIAPSTLQSALSRGRVENIEMLNKIADALSIDVKKLLSYDSMDSTKENRDRIIETLTSVGLCCEPNFPDGKRVAYSNEIGFTVWHKGSNNPSEEWVTLSYEDMAKIIDAALTSADRKRLDYLKKRLEADIF